MFGEYKGSFRHWHTESEKFTGSDSLASALLDGWEIETVYEEHTNRRGRNVTVYHFGLRRGQESITMPLIHNPYVDRLVRKLRCEVVSVDIA